MRKLSVLFVAAQVVILSSAAWLYAQQQKKLPSMLPPADHLEILQLYGYYARDVGSGTRRAAGWMYTDDGVFDTGSPRKGQAMRDGYVNLQKTRKAGIRHFATNPVIVPTAEGARASIYMMQVEREKKDGPVKIGLFGKYEDTLVKTPKGWRFKERLWRSDTHHEDTTPVMPSPFAPVE